MRQLALFLIAGASLSGCVTTPNPWLGQVTETEAAAAPVDCGSFPMPTQFDGDNITYDNAGVNDLEAYRVCSEANKAIAAEHAAQIGELKTARAALVSAGAAQRNIADMRQEMLEDERKHNAVMSVGYWIIILGLGLAL